MRSYLAAVMKNILLIQQGTFEISEGRGTSIVSELLKRPHFAMDVAISSKASNRSSKWRKKAVLATVAAFSLNFST